MDRALRLALFALVALPVAGAAPAAALEELQGFGSNPGQLRMLFKLPASAPAGGGPLPLVVVLHGCSQDQRFASDAGYEALAEEVGAALVVPLQQAGNNGSLCFNWFEAADVRPTGGEAESILQMVAHTRRLHDIDDERIFVTGLSAGAAMAVALLAVAPEVFSAGASFAGVPFGCASGLSGALTCMSPGVDRTREAWASQVEAAGGGPPWPRLAVWQGGADLTVAPRNAEALARQWTALHGLPDAPDREESAGTQRIERWLGEGGTALVEVRRLGELAHAQPIDPRAGCGSAAAFLTDVGVCGAREAFRFFGLLDAPAGGPGEGGVGREGEGEAEEPAGCAGAGTPLALALFALARRRRPGSARASCLSR
jgi:poly(hydroxyalkanoate) depolymerase family esterase